MIKKETVIILGYLDLIGSNNNTAFNAIKKYPLEVVMIELAGINSKLRDINGNFLDTSLKKQFAILYSMIVSSQYLNDLIDKIKSFKLKTDDILPVVFNRAGCLYGMDYCYRNLSRSNRPFQYTDQFWRELLQFILACNDVVIQVNKSNKSSNLNSLQNITAQLGILNEIKVLSNPILGFFRFISLIHFFRDDNYYQKELATYLFNIGIDDEEFLRIIFNVYFNKGQKKEYRFYIWVDKKDSLEVIKLLDWLSNYQLVKKKHKMDFLMLYKWPIFKHENRKYVILDLELLLDKLYRQFINDFYFDHLKKNGVTYKDYKKFIGKFYELFVADAFKELFKNNNDIIFRHTDQLNFGKPQKELCDIYIRHKNKIVLGQVKSTTFSDKQKFEGTYDFYNGDIVRFFKDCGVSQLAQSIIWISEYSNKVDKTTNSKSHVFPLLVLNDKFFEIPLLLIILNLEFKKLINGKNSNKFIVHNLIVMNPESAERLTTLKQNNPKFFWEIFWKNTSNNFFRPHFNQTLDFYKITLDNQRILNSFVSYFKI